MQPHELLGVRPGAPRGDVAAAFRRYALRHHPDHGGDRARFQAGLDAYRRLTASGPDAAAPARTGAAPRADVVFHRRSRAGIPSLLRLARRRPPATRRP